MTPHHGRVCEHQQLDTNLRRDPPPRGMIALELEVSSGQGVPGSPTLLRRFLATGRSIVPEAILLTSCASYGSAAVASRTAGTPKSDHQHT